MEGTRVEDCTRFWREIDAPHRPKVLLIRKSSTTVASVTAKASIDTTLQVQDEKKGANEHTHASGAMSAPPQPDVANVNRGPVPHKNSGGRNSQPDAAKAKVNFTTTTATSAALVNPNVGDQLVAEGLPIVGAQTAASKSHCDVVTPPVLQKVLLGSKGGAPLPHNLSPQKPSVCFSSDSDIRRQMLNFTQHCAVHYMTFTSSSIERVGHVAMLARASRLVSTVKVEAVTKKVAPTLVNPSGAPQAKNIPTRRFSCRIVKPIAKVRENPHSFLGVKPIAMVRKNPPFARTFLLRLEEKEHYSDPTFMRTILFPLKENAIYEVRAMDEAKPLLEVKRILQRVGPTNPRGVVAN